MKLSKAQINAHKALNGEWRTSAVMRSSDSSMLALCAKGLAETKVENGLRYFKRK